MRLRLIIPGFALFLFFLLASRHHLYASPAAPSDLTNITDELQVHQQQLQQMTAQLMQQTRQSITPTQAIPAVDIGLLRELLPNHYASKPNRKLRTQAEPTPSQCLVTSATDNGAGTLRHCLSTATAGVTITFDSATFPPIAPVSITLQMTLPAIITDHVTIDASNAGVILDGHQLPDARGNHGLMIDGADGVVVRGLQIVNFPRSGILLEYGTTNALIGGSRAVGQGPLGQGNLLSGNLFGIAILDEPTSNNHLLGNYVGVDRSGARPWPNTSIGVLIGFCAHDNLVGGDTPATRNVISGNAISNVQIQDPCAVNNQVAGNEIGVAINGGSVVAQGKQNGITLQDAPNNRIGGLSVAERNVIGGNDVGLWIQGETAAGNQIIGNYIGVDASGVYSVSNRVGIMLGFNAHHNVIGGPQPTARNLVSGNFDPTHQHGEAGIEVQNGAAYNQILGNYIGVDYTGNRFLSNGFDGIALGVGAHDNVIGGDQAEEGNLISGNNLRGILFQDADTTANRVLGNTIGLAADGVTPLADNPQQTGIVIAFGAHHNQIGGENPGEGNLISDHIISGISIMGDVTNGNQVQGNLIGVKRTGQQALGNTTGIFISNSSQNVVGGRTMGARNLISGNSLGVALSGEASTQNRVEGNWIGVNLSGTAAISNVVGVDLFDGAHDNIIGGEIPGAGNLISGNRDAGIAMNTGNAPEVFTHDNQILGNWIGVDASGTQALGNNTGVALSFNTRNNRVGGTTSAARNLISGNKTGVFILGGGAEFTFTGEGNQVLGNWIGLDVSGLRALGNDFGVQIAQRTRQNIIGGQAPTEGNVISSNRFVGIGISGVESTENVIGNNVIGLAADSTTPMGNGAMGVMLLAGTHHNQIGISNTIAYNAVAGIYITGTTTTKNVFTRNLIFANHEGAIVFTPPVTGPSGAIKDYDSSTRTIRGHACANCQVEMFACTSDQPAAERFLAAGVADAQGAFVVQLAQAPPLPYLTFTYTDKGATSALSDVLDTHPKLLYLPVVAR